MNCADNTFSQHPLIRQGASQQERFLDTLHARSLQLDPRSFQQWLQFIYEFSESIHYYNIDNEKDGNWKIFWEKEPTAMLAIAASVDIESMEAAYRHLELEYWRRKRKLTTLDKRNPIAKEDSPDTVLELLIEEIFKVPDCLLELCKKIPYEQPLKSEIAQLVKANLQKPMDDLISYHKSVATTDLLDRYRRFFDEDENNNICQAAWGINEDAFLSKERDDSFNLEKLRRLYLQFRKVLLNIRERATKALQRNLFTRKDHQPHLTLLLTFLQLFRYLQQDLNKLPERHLHYYYLDVLQLAFQRDKPDTAHLLLGIAPNLPDGFQVRRGTRFVGGADQSGKNRLYMATESTIINHAEIASLQSLTFLTHLDPNATDLTPQIIGAIHLPAANMLDGQKSPLPENDNAWSGLNGLAAANWVYKKSIYDLLKAGIITDANYPVDFSTFLSKRADDLPDYYTKIYEKLAPILPKFGLVIATPELLMDRSKRRLIHLIFDKIDEKLKIAINNGAISLWLSTAEGLMQVKHEYANTTSDPIFDQNSTSLTNIKNGYKIVDADNQLIIQLSPKFPGVAPVSDMAPPDSRCIKTPYPYLLLQLEDVTQYDALKAISFTALSIQTKSDEIGNLILQIGNSVVPSTTDIPLIGDTIYIGIKEATTKNNLLSSKLIIHQKTGEEIVAITPTPSNNTAILANYNWLTRTADTKLQTIPFSEVKKITKYEKGKTIAGFIKGKIIKVDNTKFSGENITLSYTTEEVPIFPIPEDGSPEVQFFYSQPVNNMMTIDGKLILLPTIDIPQPDDPANQAPEPQPAAIIDDVGDAPNPVNVGINPVPQAFERSSATIATTLSEPNPSPRKKSKQVAAPVVEQPAERTLETARTFGGTTSTEGAEVVNFAHGNLFIGIKKIKPGQILSLLVQVAEGTGNAEALAPNITWSYWTAGGWVQFPAHFILNDGTLGLTKTGIIRFQIPSDISLNGCDAANQVYYIRASATEDRLCNTLLEALPLLVGIHPQAIAVRFLNQGNSLEHLDKGLPAGSITQLQFRDVSIKKIEQPYVSFGGQQPESVAPDKYLRRVSERLRHKKRAVNVWDYERLVLENYPNITVAKALSHTNIDDAGSPGYVTVAVIPNIKRVSLRYRFTPTVEAGVLRDIRKFLSKKNSFFVGGANALDHCCCHEKSDTADTKKEGCSCGCQSASLQVVNARFEPVRVKLCVRFRSGEDVNLSKRRLDNAIENFLAPWANDHAKPILFGSPIYTSQLLDFIERQEYVDVITDFRIKHFKNVKEADQAEITTPWEQPAVIEPFSPRGVLTTYQNSINANNSNTIDHEINVFEGSSCGCVKCEEKEIVKQVESRLYAAFDVIKQEFKEVEITESNIEEFKKVAAPYVKKVMESKRVVNDIKGVSPNEAYKISFEFINNVPMLAIKAAIGNNKELVSIQNINLNKIFFKP